MSVGDLLQMSPLQTATWEFMPVGPYYFAHCHVWKMNIPELFKKHTKQTF